MIKKVLFTWELGAGFGHLSPIYRVAKKFHEKGYEIWFASQYLDDVHKVFTGFPVKTIQAPTNFNKQKDNSIVCYADILFNIGYSNAEELAIFINSWKNIYELIKPDLIVHDYSPTAMLASLEIDSQKIYIGSTFSNQKDIMKKEGHQSARLYEYIHTDQSKDRLEKHSEAVEIMVLNNINTALTSCGMKTILNISDIYSDINKTIYLTLPELDHYQRNEYDSDTHFIVSEGFKSNNLIQWPDSETAIKIFGYLKIKTYSKDSIAVLLKALKDKRFSSILYLAGDFSISEELPNNIKLVTQPVNIEMMQKQADVFLCNANLNSVIDFLMSSTPIGMLPLTPEQELLAGAAESKGYAFRVNKIDKRSIVDQLIEASATVNNAVSEKYSGVDFNQLLDDVLSEY